MRGTTQDGTLLRADDDNRFVVFRTADPDADKSTNTSINISYTTQFDFSNDKDKIVYRDFLNNNQKTNAFVRTDGIELVISDCFRQVSLDFYFESCIYSNDRVSKSRAVKIVDDYERRIYKEYDALRKKLDRLQEAIRVVETCIKVEADAAISAAQATYDEIAKVPNGTKVNVTISSRNIDKPNITYEFPHWSKELKKAVRSIDTRPDLD